MGSYVYKVTAKKVKLIDGTEANVAIFAYKPFGWDSDNMNGRMAFQAGVPAADRYVKGKNYTGKIILGESGEVAMFYDGRRGGSFDDYQFDQMKEAGRVR
jgi:hypothetical protein